MNYVANNHRRYSEHFSHVFLRNAPKSIKFSDSSDISPTQFCIMICLASARSLLSAFKIAISNIIQASSQKQMCWPDAIWIVATMKNEKSIRNRSHHDHPCPTMGAQFLFDAHNGAVSPASPGSPFPARTKFGTMLRHWAVFIHLRPKASWECFGKSLRGQILSGKRWAHSVSRLIVCHALGCLESARELLRSYSVNNGAFAI